MSQQLDGRRVLIMTSNTGVEHDELTVPRDRLRELGAQVVHVAPDTEAVQTFQHDVDKDELAHPESGIDEVAVTDFDVLVVPGGTVNADKLRVEDRAVEVAKEFAAAGKPIAAICHGPWLLVEAELLPGKSLTSYHSLRTDLTNAGGKWSDQSVVRSTENGWTLITSRNPGDLPDFCEAIAKELTPETDQA